MSKPDTAEARKALRALYLAAPAGVVEAVNAKIKPILDWVDSDQALAFDPDVEPEATQPETRHVWVGSVCVAPGHSHGYQDPDS